MTKEEFEKEVEATIAELPQKPPEDTISLLNSRGKLLTEYLIYKLAPNRRDVIAKCSACGNTFMGTRLHMGVPWQDQQQKEFYLNDEFNQTLGERSISICPYCGEAVKCVHTSSFNPHEIIDRCFCTGFFNIRGHLCVLSYVIDKRINHSGESYYTQWGYDGTIIIDKKFVRVCGFKMHLGCIQLKFDWERRKKYIDKVSRVHGYEILSNGFKEIENTDCANSAIDVFYEQCKDEYDFYPLGYLKLWTKYPNIENLVRQGFGKYVAEVISKISNRGYGYGQEMSYNTNLAKNYIDVKKVKPHEMLGVEKHELSLIRKLNLKEIDFYKFIRNTKDIKLNIQQMKEVRRFAISDLKKLLSEPIHGFSPPVIKTINYLYKQVENGGKGLVSVSYLNDYWKMVFKVHKSLPETMRYPKDLVKAHDRMVLLIKERESKKLNELISGRFKELDNLSFADEETGLMIRPCATHGEIIKEGKILIHCVATYAKSYAEGKTSIFFIRKISEPDIPYYTLEFKNGKVAQNRGLRNCARTEDVKIFEEKWLNYIRTLKENDNGKSNNTACA